MTDQRETGLPHFNWSEWSEGATPAFTTFFRDQFAGFFAFADALLQDRVSARNVAAEAIFLLWRKHADFDNLVNCKTFLYNTIRLHCLQYLKYLQTHPDTGVYIADEQRWPLLTAGIREEMLAFAQVASDTKGA